MPLYDFKCPDCGRIKELNVKDRDAPVYCHNCDGIMERQISAPYGKVTGYSYENGYSRTPNKER